MKAHTVSVIIPCAESHRRYVLGAVESALACRPRVDDVIVVMDGCSSGICFPPGTSEVQIDRSERSIARNEAVEVYAKTDWIFFLDADDLMAPTAMEDFLAVATHAFLDLFYADYEYFFDVPGSERHLVKKRLFDLRCPQYNAWNIGMFMRRQRFLDLGGFDPWFTIGEYWDLALRYVSSISPRRPVIVKGIRPLFAARAGTSVSPQASERMMQLNRIMGALLAGGYYPNLERGIKTRRPRTVIPAMRQPPERKPPPPPPPPPPKGRRS